MTRVRWSLHAALAAAVLTCSAASAHVTVGPAPDGAAAARGEVAIGVPNESQTADTTSVAVRIPDNAIDVQVPAVTGWRSRTASVALTPPVQIGDRTLTTRVDTVTWTGRLAPGRRATLRLRVRVREGTARRGLEFPAVQRYADGTVVRWIGPTGSATPAGVLATPLPVVRVVGPPATIPPQTPTPAPATVTLTRTVADDGGGTDAALIGGLAAIAAALAGGAIWLTRRRKRSG